MYNLGSIIGLNVTLGTIILICVCGIAYAVNSYITMCQGRKAGLRDDWFAFVPVAASIYKLDMVGEGRWKIIFVGGLSKMLLLLLFILCDFMGRLNVVVLVLFELILLGFWAMRIVLTYIYKRKVYRLFKFNENLAMLDLLCMISCLLIFMGTMIFFGIADLNNLAEFFGVAIFNFTDAIGYALSPIIGACAFIIGSIMVSSYKIYTTIFKCISAFDNRCVVGNNPDASPVPSSDPVANSGKIVCTAGMYNGAEFQVESEFEIIIGRDSFFSSIIISEGSKSVSRKHCGIRYDKSRKEYLVTDYSSNGTYIAETGERLQRNMPTPVQRGSSIYLGDKSNRFKLV